MGSIFKDFNFYRKVKCKSENLPEYPIYYKSSFLLLSGPSGLKFIVLLSFLQEGSGRKYLRVILNEAFLMELHLRNQCYPHLR